MTMKIAEVLPKEGEFQTEADAVDAQVQSLKQQQKALKVRLAQAKANKAQQKLAAARQAAAKAP